MIRRGRDDGRRPGPRRLHLLDRRTVDEAAEVLRQGIVGVVILDHSLVQSPRFATDAGTPVVLMSGMGRDEIDQIRREHGAAYHAFLAKPVPPDRLVKVVGEALAR
jgi:hypothetical protein